MSRIGKKAIPLAEGVKYKIEGQKVTLEGKRGKLQLDLPEEIEIKENDANLEVSTKKDNRKFRALHGTFRSLINNMAIGVSDGFTKQLEIKGVGFRAEVQGKALNLQLGFSHPINHPIPDDITVSVEKNVNIKVEGIDKQHVGQFAADIRAYYPPDPYKGKGVKYIDEQIRRKVGKSVK